MQKKLNEDFIEKYSEQFATKISGDFYASHSHISGQEILSITPSKQVNFFIIKLLFNNWQQESQRLESPFFNYSAPEVKEALLQFMNVLSRFIKVERKEFEQLLQDAVRDTLFLIMSPNVYLEIEFDRKGSEVLSDRVAKNILKYIKIAKSDFTTYFQANIGLDKDDLEINENIITEDFLKDEISKLNEVHPLTLKRLEEGEEDEEAEDLLNVEADDLLSPTIARSSEIKGKIEPQASEPEIEEDTEPQHTKTESEEESIAAEENENVEEDDREAEENEPESENKEPVDEEEDMTEPPPTAPDIITNMAPDEEDDEDDDILNDKFEDPLTTPTIAESHEGKEDSMMAAISVNHRYMFINELFDGEADLFTEAISKVEACTSFDESVEVLVQNYAKEYHWDMNSDEVKELLKIIFRRFR